MSNQAGNGQADNLLLAPHCESDIGADRVKAFRKSC